MTLKRYKIKKFTQEALKHQLTDSALNTIFDTFVAMGEVDQKKYSLGANLYKLRIATKEGRGKRGGSRSILAFRKNNTVIWLHLFAKNTKDNISVSELKKLKFLSDILLNLSDSELTKLIDSGDIFEVNDDV